jgi:hypothetical protein
MKLSAFALAASLLFAISANAADAHSILAVPKQRLESSDFRVTGHLVRVDANGARTSDAISIKAHWFPGVLRVLVDISPPPNASAKSSLGARVHILFEMKPDGQNVILIAHPGDKAPSKLPFDKWSDGPLGPVFSYEDFLEPEYFWPSQTALAETKYGARDCDVVNSLPGPTDRTHYAGIKTWLDHSIGFPVYVEKTLKGTETVKEFTYFGIRRNGGVWSASQVEAKIRGQAGSTLLIIDRGSAKANLVLGDFSPERLIHF